MLNYQQQEKRDTMASVGIIAEYNPFHNGHLYHIQKSIEQSGAKYTVCVISRKLCSKRQYIYSR